MKLKTIIFFFLVVILVYLIFVFEYHKENSIILIGDYIMEIKEDDKGNSLSSSIYNYFNNNYKISNFLDCSYRVTDISRMIENNQKYNNLNFKNILIKADKVILSIGNNDILNILKYNSYYSLYDSLDLLIKDYEYLFKLLRENCKEKIYLIGLFNPFPTDMNYNKAYKYLNNNLIKLALKYKIELISINDVSNNIIFHQENKLYPNLKGIEKIFNILLNNI